MTQDHRAAVEAARRIVKAADECLAALNTYGAGSDDHLNAVAEVDSVLEDDAVPVARALLAAQTERDAVIEECAKVVESQHYLSDGYGVWAAFEKTAARLRALKGTDT